MNGRETMSAFDQVIGYADIKTEMIKYCDVLKNPERYRNLGVSMPSGILLEGEPGVGKTLMAMCFIEESGCKAYVIRKNRPDGAFVDEIRHIFEMAKEEERAIVLLDDLDRFANEDTEHPDAEEYIAVQSCIDDCKDSGVFVLATVNQRQSLPESLLRAGRLGKIIEMFVPEGQDASDIIAYYLSQKKAIGNIDMEDVVKLLEGHSCAELESVVNEAGILAGFNNRDQIEHQDIVKAYIGLIFDAPESKWTEDEAYQKNMAIHEAGHAVVSEVLDPGSVNLVTICQHNGSVGGTIVVRKAHDYRISIAARENEIVRKLGGKAAVELEYGQADLGCSSDIRAAMCFVEHLIDDLCAYGFDSFLTANSSPHLYEERPTDRK